MNASSEEKINYSNDKIQIKNYKWEKEEFYNKVITQFDIFNKDSSQIDIITIIFTFYDSNDSIIIQKKETINIKLKPNQWKSIKELNVGYVKGNISTSTLQISN